LRSAGTNGVAFDGDDIARHNAGDRLRLPAGRDVWFRCVDFKALPDEVGLLL
jgi:hypothetical protein